MLLIPLRWSTSTSFLTITKPQSLNHEVHKSDDFTRIDNTAGSKPSPKYWHTTKRSKWPGTWVTRYFTTVRRQIRGQSLYSNGCTDQHGEFGISLDQVHTPQRSARGVPLWNHFLEVRRPLIGCAMCNVMIRSNMAKQNNDLGRCQL